MQVEQDGEVVITRNVELDTLTVVGETTFTGDVTVNTTLTATTVDATNLNVSGPSVLTGPVTSVAGITAASLYVSNGITAGGSLSVGGPATIGGLLTAAAGITTINIDTDTMRARDIAVDTLHVVTIDDVSVVSSVSTNVVRGVQIVAGTEDPLYTFLPGHTLDVLGNTYVTGNVGIGITGPTVALDVAGAATFGGLVTANAGITASELYVSNGITGNGTLSIAGAATFDSLVTANAGITSSFLDVSGNTNVYGTQHVYGLFTALAGITGSLLDVSGNTTLYGTETVNGLITANAGITSSSLEVSGNTNLYGTETVNGLVTANAGITSSSLEVSGNTILYGTETVNGLVTANAGITSSSLEVSGNTTLYGTETVNGLLTANTGITSSSLEVSGNTTLYGTETVEGLITANAGITSSSLNVSGNTNLYSLLTANAGITSSSLNVSGNTTLYGTETVNGLLTANAGVTSSSLNVSGNTNLYSLLAANTGITSSSLNVSGNTNLFSLLTANAGVTSSSLNVSGNTTLYGSETVNGLLTANAGITSSSLYVTNGITGNSTLQIAGTANVGGLLTASGGVTSTAINGTTITSYGELFVKSTGTQALRMVTDANRSYIQPYATPANTGSELRITKYGSATPILSIDTLNSTVGISTAASGAYTLDVNGTSRFNNLITATGGITASSLHVSGTITYGSESFDQFNANAAVIGVDTTVTAGYKLDVDGKSRFRDVLAIADGIVTAPGLSFYNDQTTGIYRRTAIEMGMVVASTERMRFVNDKIVYMSPTTTAYNGGGSGYPAGAWTQIYSGFSDAINNDGNSFMAAQGLMLRGQDLTWAPTNRSYGSKIWIGGGRASPLPVTATNAEIILETGNTPRMTISGTGNATFTNKVTVNGDFQVDGTPIGLVKSVTGTASNLSASNTGGNVTMDLVNAGTAGTYTVPASLTTDAKGRVTSVTPSTAGFSISYASNKISYNPTSYVLNLDPTGSTSTYNSNITTNASNFKRCKIEICGGGGGGGGASKHNSDGFKYGGGGGGGSGSRNEYVINYDTSFFIHTFTVGISGTAGANADIDAGGFPTPGGDGGFSQLTCIVDGGRKTFFADSGKGGGPAGFGGASGSGGNGWGGGGGGYGQGSWGGPGSSVYFNQFNGKIPTVAGYGGDGGADYTYYSDTTGSLWSSTKTTGAGNFGGSGGGPFGGSYGYSLTPKLGGGGYGGDFFATQPQPGSYGFITITFF